MDARRPRPSRGVPADNLKQLIHGAGVSDTGLPAEHIGLEPRRLRCIQRIPCRLYTSRNHGKPDTFSF
jgi:hypothetical protein